VRKSNTVWFAEMRIFGSIDAETTGPRMSRPEIVYTTPPSRDALFRTRSMSPVICGALLHEIETSAFSWKTSS